MHKGRGKKGKGAQETLCGYGPPTEEGKLRVFGAAEVLGETSCKRGETEELFGRAGWIVAGRCREVGTVDYKIRERKRRGSPQNWKRSSVRWSTSFGRAVRELCKRRIHAAHPRRACRDTVKQHISHELTLRQQCSW